MKIGRKEIVIIFLIFCIAGRVAISLFPFDGRYFYASDHNCHIYNIETIAEKGLVNWDYNWYGGTPFMKFYPVFSLWVGSLFAHFMDGLDAYKMVFLLAFSLTPIAAYFFFKEFFKKTKEILFATLLFSFTAYYSWMADIGEFPTIFSTLLALLFLTSFIRYMKYGRTIDFSVASVLFGLISFSHLIVAYVSALLAFIYLITFFIDRKFDLKKFASGLAIFAIGLAIGAFWLIPASLELGQTSFTTQHLILPLFSVPIVNFLKVYTYSFAFNFIPIVSTILAAVLMLYGIKKSLRWNSDNAFLLVSLALFVATYFSLHSLLPLSNFPFGRWMAFMPLITTILITKALDKKILAYLAVIFLVSQIALFLAFPTSTLNVEPYKEVAGYLSDKDGRVAYVPKFKLNSDLDTVFDNLLPQYSSEYASGFWPQGQSPKRYIMSMDIDMYLCEGDIKSASPFDLSIRKTELTSDGVKCTIRGNASDELLRMQNVGHVIVNNRFPDVLSRFENDPNFTKVKQIGQFIIMELDGGTYIRTEPSVDWNYSKETDRIELYLSSKEPVYNVSMMISESWYPHWKAEGIEIAQDDRGFMVFTLPELNGSRHITIEFVRPFYYRIGEWITLLALIGIVSLTAVKWKQPLIQNKTKGR